MAAGIFSVSFLVTIGGMLIGPHLCSSTRFGFSVVSGLPLPALCIVFMVAAAIMMVREGAGPVKVLAASAATYFAVGILFGGTYYHLSETKQFSIPLSPIDAFYFSFITLTTVGFGDIVPVGTWAKVFVIIEAVTGTFLNVILFATASTHFYARLTTNNQR